MSSPSPRELLTLEPLIEAVRQGVEESGWQMSGLQKTTSHEFEGRWEGESTRSAYLFFHSSRHLEGASIEAYLDETSRGLQGNLALVLDGRSLGDLGEPAHALGKLGAAATECTSANSPLAISLRARLPTPAADPLAAAVEFRFKLRLPASVVRDGAQAVSSLATRAVEAFELLAGHEQVRRFAVLD